MASISVDKVKDVLPLAEATVTEMAGRAIKEVLRQDDLARAGKFGGTHILPSGPDHARLAVLVEEVGEVARELNEGLMLPVVGTDLVALQKELIQVGACAIAWAAALQSEIRSRETRDD